MQLHCTTDFEVGFRRITQLVIGQPCSSWEVFSLDRDDGLFQALQLGYVLRLIAKELAEWLIVETLWPPVEEYAARQTPFIFRGTPQPPIGIVLQCKLLTK